MKKISEFITYEEATKSIVAVKNNIDNTPNEEQLKNMKYIADNIHTPCRLFFKCQIGVSSFFRSLKLNKKIGSKAVHGHPDGVCIDMDCDMYGHITNKQLFKFIYDNLKFTQLIYEYPKDKKNVGKDAEWIHVTLRKGSEDKKEILICDNDFPNGRRMSKMELDLILKV